MHYQSLAAKDKRRYGIELVKWYESKEDESVPGPSMSYLSSRKPRKKNVRDLQLRRRRPAKNERAQMPNTKTIDLQYHPSVVASSSQESQETETSSGVLSPASNFSIFLCPRPIEDIARDPGELLRRLDTDEMVYLKKLLGVRDETLFRTHSPGYSSNSSTEASIVRL